MFTFTLKFSCHRKKNFVWKKKEKMGTKIMYKDKPKNSKKVSPKKSNKVGCS